MENERQEALDPASKIAVALVDCVTAAGQLARGHLSGPVASKYLSEALAGVALLGVETSQPEETVTFRLDATDSALGGFLVEATEKGTLRGYTKKKILGDFDGMGEPKDSEILGKTGTFEVIRSVPGEILASGAVGVAFTGKNGFIAQGLDAYFAQSLQRRVKTALVGAAGDDGMPVLARGVMVECPPDGDAAVYESIAGLFASSVAAKAISGASLSFRSVLKKLGLPNAEIRRTSPISFACRCSPSRASALLAALPPEQRKTLPATVDVTCHMCGRTWQVTTV